MDRRSRLIGRIAGAIILALLVASTSIVDAADRERGDEKRAHQAPELERALSGLIAGDPKISSLKAKMALRQWRPRGVPLALLKSSGADPARWILDWTCAVPQQLTGARLHGKRDVRVLRVAGADTEVLREAYLQARRYPDGIIELAGRGDHIDGWLATADWRPEQLTFGDRVVHHYPRVDPGLYVYVVGDLIYEVVAHQDEAEAILDLLPAPGADTSAYGPRVEAATATCAGPGDPELLALLPKTSDDFAQTFDPWPIPYSGLDHSGKRRERVDWLAQAADATPETFSGYGYSLPNPVGAISVAGADVAAMERACDALRSNGPYSCLVRDDMLFYSAGWGPFSDTFEAWMRERSDQGDGSLVVAQAETVIGLPRPGMDYGQITTLLREMKAAGELEMDPEEFRSLVSDPPTWLRDERRFLRRARQGKSVDEFLSNSVFQVPTDITPEDLLRLMLGR